MQFALEAKRALVPWPLAGGAYGVNLQLCVLEYALVNSAWCAAQRRWPPRAALAQQVASSLFAAPFYAALPTCVELFADWTRLHGGRASALEALAFLCAVEAMVYATHRALHEVPWLYRNIHRRHHEYKTAEELSPFASMAFMPLDGLAQAAPYALVALVLPCHAVVWELFLFATGVWSSFIHDTVHRDVPGLLGAGYHTLHHTRFRCNYGQYTQALDWACGTLVHPGRALQRQGRLKRATCD